MLGLWEQASTKPTGTSYKNQANTGSYNTKMQWSPIGSGPFMIQSYTPGQSVMLAPNPHYGGVPGIPPQNITVVINWVKTPDTALLMLQDGEADVGVGFAAVRLSSSAEAAVTRTREHLQLPKFHVCISMISTLR